MSAWGKSFVERCNEVDPASDWMDGVDLDATNIGLPIWIMIGARPLSKRCGKPGATPDDEKLFKNKKNNEIIPKTILFYLGSTIYY